MNKETNDELTTTDATAMATVESRVEHCPQVDLSEGPEGVTILADMPGVAPDAADVTMEKNLLTIRGSIHEAPRAGFADRWTELPAGDYVRSFRLGDDLDTERIEARIKDGVLRVFVPHRSGGRRRIEVRST